MARMFFSGVRVHSDGTFELPNVTPGEYTIIGWLYGEQVHSAQQDIEVGSTDVEGLTLVVGMGVNVRGTVVWERKAKHCERWTDGSGDTSDGKSSDLAVHCLHWIRILNSCGRIYRKASFAWT